MNFPLIFQPMLVFFLSKWNDSSGVFLQDKCFSCSDGGECLGRWRSPKLYKLPHNFCFIHNCLLNTELSQCFFLQFLFSKNITFNNLFSQFATVILIIVMQSFLPKIFFLFFKLIIWYICNSFFFLLFYFLILLISCCIT